ncbi:Ribonuclease H [Parasponia andersonii]|uniref:Ribonuclease H n=1 Tax=Parasponia andersonii TaxID=3476 RepID=A0A2P5AJ07_PARAD|nr:Ribonuclease H [Parasponia andersonii]
MNCLSQFSSHIEAVFRIGRFRAGTCLYGAYPSCSWSSRRISYSPRITTEVNLNSSLTSFGARLYSSKKGAKNDTNSCSSGTKTASRRRKSKSEPEMEQEKDAFYVVRKGDVLGVYRSLNDCQAQVGSSICDPPVSVFKGYRLPKDTKEYLTSRGLKDALYTIRAEDLKEGILGTLVQCPLQVPTPSLAETSAKDTSKKRSQLLIGSDDMEAIGSISTDPSRKHAKLDHSAVGRLSSVDCRSCILKFDGASKGNPGKAGAGAVLLTDDGSLVNFTVTLWGLYIYYVFFFHL